jgi:hypothetical protein
VASIQRALELCSSSAVARVSAVQIYESGNTPKKSR